MWKWILVGAGVVVGVGIIFVIILAVSNPQGFADFFLNIADEFDVSVDGKRHKIKIDKFEGGTTANDRTFLVQKMLALFARVADGEEYKSAWQGYSRELYEVAQDRTLTAEENRRLRELHDDIVSEDEAERWMDKFIELDESGRGEEWEDAVRN